ncbi:response regulator transcription factor [beta proteobacterium MWH-UniP1]
MASPLNIVVVEDHDLLREATVAALASAGHHVVGLIAAEELEDSPQTHNADIFVLDLNLPGEDGISLAKRLRAASPRVGIIMTTARTHSDQRAQGYESGADIYLSKPVAPEELLAAVSSLGRRLRGTGQEERQLSLDTQAMQLLHGDIRVSLTPGETQLLAAFARAPNFTLERFQVAEHLNIGLDRLEDSATMEVRVSKIRKKLEQAGCTETIRPIRGVGYRLATPIVLKS